MARLLPPDPSPAMPATHHLLLALLHLLTCTTLCLADVAIPYTVLGPTPASIGGMYALRSSYNQSYVPWNTSYPTLHIGLSLSLLGTAKEEGWTDFLAMLVDVTNFRGGVRVNGVPHYVTLTYSVDDGSTHLTQLIYSDMFASGNYSAYIAPQSDALLQALLPLLPASNATVISTYNPDPADFSSGYRNLFGLLPPDTLLFRVSLTAINERAQRYAADGGDGSVYGIQTMCMFTVNESLPQARAAGVRQWIDEENARRNRTHNITLLVDTVWQRTALDYGNYTTALAACPDNVDVMVLSASDRDSLDAALALKASQLRPKAVIGLVSDRTINLGDAAQLTTAAGWTIPVSFVLGPASIYDVGGLFTDIYDVQYANTVWRAGAGLTDVPQNAYAYTYVTSFSVITAALALTRSLQPADMRDAVMSLNGQTTAFSGIEFDADTGFNTQLIPLVSQALPSGQYVTVNSSGPWRLPADGDLLNVRQSINAVLIAIVISVLGAWVALIITEQSIYLKRHGSRYWPLWLFLVSLALGGVAVWCTQVMTSTGLQTSLAATGAVLPMSYSFDVAIIALVPGVLLTYAGLLVLMGDVHSVGHRSTTAATAGSSSQTPAAGSDARAARSAELELTAQKQREQRAARLSTRLHLQHLRRSVSWRVLVGGFLVTCAMYESRATLLNVWVQPAQWELTAYVWLLVWLFDVLLVSLACLLLVHSIRRRYLCAFLFAAAVVGDWFIVQQGVTFYYLTTGEPLPSALLTANVSYTAISLMAGIIAAGICFIFIGLQFSRMQLSRNGLSILAASMQANIARLQHRLKVSDDSNAQLKLQLSAMCKAAAHTAINTPIHTHYAYCMAQATTMDAYQSVWQFVSSSANRTLPSTAITARTRKILSASSSSSSPVLAPRVSIAASETAMSNRPPLRLPSITMTPTRSASVAPLPPLPTLRLRGSTAADDTERASQDGTAESSRSVAAVDPSPPLTSLASTAPATIADKPSTTALKCRSSISGSGGGNGGESVSRSKRSLRNNRGYEEQLALLLDQYSPYDSADTPPAILSPGGQNKASVSIQANTAHNGGLAALLTHPACIAVIKGELQAIHSVENLIFYLHAQRYRQLQSGKLRKQVATAMYETFIREGAEQQININARQRDGIGFCVTKRGDDGCSSGLFDDAQREVLQLMEANLLGSKAERQCAWLMAQLPLSTLMGIGTNEEETE